MSQFEIVLLILASTVCLLAIAQRVRAGRGRRAISLGTMQELSAHRVARRTLRLTQSGGQRHIILDGVEVRDSKAIIDPGLRAALAQGEEALAEVERTLKVRQKRTFVINGHSYQDLADIPDPHMRKLADVALHKS